MGEFIDNLRYDHPILFRTTVGLISLVIAILIFASLPPSPFLRAIGVTGAQKKLAATYYALFWQIRSMTNQEAEATMLKSVYGNMLGLDVKGRLIISTPVGSKYVESRVHIADAKLVDLYGTAAKIGQLRAEDAKFDFYSNDEVVAWIRDVPFNVKLIEEGYAEPDPSPPTNIVDKAFAAYYWRVLKGR